MKAHKSIRNFTTTLTLVFRLTLCLLYLREGVLCPQLSGRGGYEEICTSVGNRTSVFQLSQPVFCIFFLPYPHVTSTNCMQRTLIFIYFIPDSQFMKHKISVLEATIRTCSGAFIKYVRYQLVHHCIIFTVLCIFCRPTVVVAC